MHEYSIISALLEQCEEYASNANAAAIEVVVVGIGEQSGVEPALLQSAFETFKLENPYTTNARLEIELQPIMLSCKHCGQSAQAQQGRYGVCAQCGSSAVEITQGRDMLLLRLEMLESQS